MTKINLSTLKPGDIVHFRCGGKAKVISSAYYDDESIWVTMDGYKTFYNVDGAYTDCVKGPFDIVKITKKTKKRSKKC